MSNVKEVRIVAKYNPYNRTYGTARDKAYLEVAKIVGSWLLTPSFGLRAEVTEEPGLGRSKLDIDGKEAVSWTFLGHLVKNLKAAGAEVEEAWARDIETDEEEDLLHRPVQTTEAR